VAAVGSAAHCNRPPRHCGTGAPRPLLAGLIARRPPVQKALGRTGGRVWSSPPWPGMDRPTAEGKPSLARHSPSRGTVPRMQPQRLSMRRTNACAWCSSSAFRADHGTRVAPVTGGHTNAKRPGNPTYCRATCMPSKVGHPPRLERQGVAAPRTRQTTCSRSPVPDKPSALPTPAAPQAARVGCPTSQPWRAASPGSSGSARVRRIPRRLAASTASAAPCPPTPRRAGSAP